MLESAFKPFKASLYRGGGSLTYMYERRRLHTAGDCSTAAGGAKVFSPLQRPEIHHNHQVICCGGHPLRRPSTATVIRCDGHYEGTIVGARDVCVELIY